MSEALYVASYHQSRFGKPPDLTVPAILRNAVDGARCEIAVNPSALAVASAGAMCNVSLNEQSRRPRSRVWRENRSKNLVDNSVRVT